jgi:hypothetical protein
MTTLEQLYAYVRNGARRLYVGRREWHEVISDPYTMQAMPGLGVSDIDAMFMDTPVVRVAVPSYCADTPPCPHCKTPLPADAHYCITCGSPVAKTGETTRLA